MKGSISRVQVLEESIENLKTFLEEFEQYDGIHLTIGAAKKPGPPDDQVRIHFSSGYLAILQQTLSAMQLEREVNINLLKKDLAHLQEFLDNRT